MRKFLILFFILICCISKAQISPLKLALGLGYAENRFRKGIGNGGLFYAEPAYQFSENLLIGFRIEDAAMTRGISTSSNDHLSSTVSFTLNGQHYFSDNYARPFIGLGFGIYSMAPVISGNTSNERQNAGSGTSFGLYPRVGIDVGHLNLTVDYNVIPSYDVPRDRKVVNSYLAMKAGFSFGGFTGKQNRNIR
jgi:outer membrane protein X